MELSIRIWGLAWHYVGWRASGNADSEIWEPAMLFGAVENTFSALRPPGCELEISTNRAREGQKESSDVFPFRRCFLKTSFDRRRQWAS
jgi:hypothetical protein